MKTSELNDWSDEDWNKYIFKVFTQVNALFLALLGYRGLMRGFLDYQPLYGIYFFFLFFGVIGFLVAEFFP